MTLSRRDFINLFGISVASLMLTRCRVPFLTTCYTPLPPTTVTPAAASVRERLRQCWFSFDNLADATRENPENTMSSQLFSDHRAALDELVARGELSASVADLVQEAYGAALDHVYSYNNTKMTCYEPARIDYAPTSAGILVSQSATLEQIAASGSIDPATLETARIALEQDMAFYALTEQEVQALYDTLLQQHQNTDQTLPEFDALPLDLTPEARAAAQFILDLLTEK